MNTEEDVKRMQDIVDSMSSFGEKMGFAIRNFLKIIFKNIQISFIFVIFGIFIGVFYNFLRALFIGKKTN